MRKRKWRILSLLLVAVMTLGILFGCSKDNKTEKQIVGDWFMCYSKTSDSSQDYYEEDTYTQETSNMFLSFYNDGTMKASTNPDLGGSEQYVVNGTWSIEDGTLIMTHPEDGSESYSKSLLFLPHHSRCSETTVISAGTPMRAGNIVSPRPSLTYRNWRLPDWESPEYRPLFSRKTRRLGSRPKILHWAL